MLAATTFLAGLVSAWALMLVQRAADLRVASVKAAGREERVALAVSAEELRTLGTAWLLFLLGLIVGSLVIAIIRTGDDDLSVESAVFIGLLALGSLVLAGMSLRWLGKQIADVQSRAA